MTLETLTYITLLATCIGASTAVEPQTCPGPNEWFTAEFVAIADKLIPISVTAISPETGLNFFRDTMLFSEEEIKQAEEDAIAFFNTRYGLDFSRSEPDELGRRFFENSTLFVFELPLSAGYTVTFNRWLIDGRTTPTCFPNHDGGFRVTFSSEQILHGTYGGHEGKPIQPGDALVWGFYSIPVCPQQPLVIHYESRTPFRLEPIDGFSIINSDLYHHELGEGIGQGFVSVTSTDNPDVVHLSIRNLFTFPAHPGLPSD